MVISPGPSVSLSDEVMGAGEPVSVGTSSVGSSGILSDSSVDGSSVVTSVVGGFNSDVASVVIIPAVLSVDCSVESSDLSVGSSVDRSDLSVDCSVGDSLVIPVKSSRVSSVDRTVGRVLVSLLSELPSEVLEPVESSSVPES